MKQLKQRLSIEKCRETQYSGGNVCMNSTGEYLICIFGSSVNVIDTKTGSIIYTLESEEEEVTCICLSPDDKHLITAHRNLLLKQWDNWLPSESNQKSTSKSTRTWKAIHQAPIRFMCFDNTSTLLATASSDYTTKIWDIEAQYCTHNLKGATALLTYVKFHPLIEEVQHCATGCDDGKIRLYNLNTSKQIACLEGHFSTVTCFEFLLSDDGSSNKYDKLISSSRDKVLIVWNLEDFSKIRTVPIYESIESFFLTSQLLNKTSSLNDRYLVSAGNDGILKLWDVNKMRCLYKQSESESLKILNKESSNSTELGLTIVQGLFNKQTGCLVLVTSDQMIIFIRVNIEVLEMSLEKGTLDQESLSGLFKIYKQYIGDHGEILDTQFCNKAENLLAVATNSEFLKIYDLNTWDCKLLKGHTDLIISLSVYYGKNDKNNTSYLASSSKDNTIRLWKIEEDPETNDYTYECISVCQGHTQDVGALCFSRLGFNFLVSASIDTTIKLWNIKTPLIKKSDKNDSKMEVTVAFTIKAHDKDINSVSVSPNDKLIASGSSDKTAKIWDAGDGSCLAVLRGHKRGIWSIQFSPVDQLVATSSADATIKLWSLTDFTCAKTFEGHNTSVLKVFFLNHGTQLISSASDGLLKLWNIKTNECVGTFDEHNDKIWALCVSSDENRYVTGGADGKLIVWKDITEEEYEQELEKREEILLQEQELSNFLQEKKWKKALRLAILLDKPFKCYEIIKEILQQYDSADDNEMIKNKGRLDLENTLLKLRDDQIRSLIKYATDWNTNTKFCHLAQIVFELVLKNYPPEFFITDANSEFAVKIVEQFLPYTERHFVRLNKLEQQIMFIDFAWQNMKLEDKNNQINQ